ncbi:hypothetical protein PoB_003635200 [Plakobranchus ocellatus]|uniref:Uncharacterized protein n=1 Tax=Plakobranchus ocellatus TaxID=259542 RepID=A0AAV4ARB0_9GAST|nr:hypothetical protein PoB_003635200 [Plakobranchus ocellatus]
MLASIQGKSGPFTSGCKLKFSKAKENKFDGKRGRGRPREKMLDSLADWMNIEKPSEMIRKMSCRDGWRSMIAHASRHGT